MVCLSYILQLTTTYNLGFRAHFKFLCLYHFSGTSTDVSRYAGHLEHVFETTTAGITIQAPQVRDRLVLLKLDDDEWWPPNSRITRHIKLYCILYIQLDVNTVAAGGGSRLFFRSGIFVVGPESVGAHPGPVCYRKGSYLRTYGIKMETKSW